MSWDPVRPLTGIGDWLETLWLAPFVAAGIALLVYALRQMWFTTEAGATRVEISAHPLHPGETYELFFSQTGLAKMAWLEMALVCEEVATFRQGTNTRPESLSFRSITS